MTQACKHYLQSYSSILSFIAKLPSGEEDETALSTSHESMRKKLCELYAKAVRTLSDREAYRFKRRCEELEDELLIQ